MYSSLWVIQKISLIYFVLVWYFLDWLHLIEQQVAEVIQLFGLFYMLVGYSVAVLILILFPSLFLLICLS